MPTRPHDGRMTPTITFDQHDAVQILQSDGLYSPQDVPENPPRSPDPIAPYDDHLHPRRVASAMTSDWPKLLSLANDLLRRGLRSMFPRRPVKKALLIGLKYTNQHPKQVLEGTHKDVDKMKEFLIRHGDFLPENILTLKDDKGANKVYPTAKDIWVALKEFVRGAQPGDLLFLLFCGHGFRVVNKNGEEPDGFDEVILGVDYDLDEVKHPKTGENTWVASRGFIMDDHLYNLTIGLPPKCSFIALFDCCHSGTALDLPIERKLSWSVVRSLAPKRRGCSDQTPRTPKNFIRLPYVTTGAVVVKEVAKIPRTPTYLPESHFCDEPEGTASLNEAVLETSAYRKSTIECSSRSRKENIKVKLRHKYPRLISFSACADDQEAFEDSQGNGVLVAAFIKSLESHPRPTYIKLLEDLTEASYNENKDRKKELWPHPQLGSLFEIGPTEVFELCSPLARTMEQILRMSTSFAALGLVASIPIYSLLRRFWR